MIPSGFDIWPTAPRPSRRVKDEIKKGALRPGFFRQADQYAIYSRIAFQKAFQGPEATSLWIRLQDVVNIKREGKEKLAGSK